jgi:hypothetical protein
MMLFFKQFDFFIDKRNNNDIYVMYDSDMKTLFIRIGKREVWISRRVSLGGYCERNSNKRADQDPKCEPGEA